MGAEGELTEAVSRLVAVDAITTLLARYCRAFDDQDEASLASLWADAATYELAGRGAASGSAEIVALARQVWAEVVESHHHITNRLIDVHGAEAVVTADVLLHRVSRSGESALVSGRYDLALVESHGNWRISRVSFRGKTVVA